jgi:hypothetical protein
VTYTTFAVSDALQGQSRLDVHDQAVGRRDEGGLNYRAYGIPKFSVGQHVVVFLYGKSSAGFSSPVGLAQGRFAVGTMRLAESVSNGRDFPRHGEEPGQRQRARRAGEIDDRAGSQDEPRAVQGPRPQSREGARHGDGGCAMSRLMLKTLAALVLASPLAALAERAAQPLLGLGRPRR